MHRFEQNVLRTVVLLPALCFATYGNAYEINNHADMSQRAGEIVFPLAGTNEKLFRLGLKRLAISDPNQKFPLDPSLPSIRYCFGEYLPGQPAREYDKAVLAGLPVAQDGQQPSWATGGIAPTQLTIAQFIRYGAC